MIWLERKQKRTKIQELGVKIDFNPLRQRLDVDNPPQPQRLWGVRGKNNTPLGETAPWVTARPVTWEEVARISLEGADAALEKIADDGRWWLEKNKHGRVYIRWEEVTKFDEYDVCLLSATPDVPSLKKIFVSLT